MKWGATVYLFTLAWVQCDLATAPATTDQPTLRTRALPRHIAELMPHFLARQRELELASEEVEPDFDTESPLDGSWVSR